MLRRLPAVLLSLLLVTAGCGGQAAVGPAAVQSAASAFNGTDIAWLQLMIPMNEQALRLFEIVDARLADEPTRQLAATYRAELDQLRALRTRAGAPTTNLHEGHDMPGLVTAEDLRAATDAEGTELSRLVQAHVREQLDQAILLCQGERVSGADPATRELAAAIETTRTAHRSRL